MYTISSHPPTPIEATNTITHNITRVSIALPNPFVIFFWGFTVSSATFATPSIPRKNQIANGIAAKIPPQPFILAFFVKLSAEKWGIVTPKKSNNSATASIVINNSKVAAIFTPNTLSVVNNK